MLLSDFGGRVPDNLDDLLKLPGVGRKTANLILGDIYNKPSIVVDTHCIRITNLLGLAQGKDPVKIEDQLREILEPSGSGAFCHRIVPSWARGLRSQEAGLRKVWSCSHVQAYYRNIKLI
jgi:endonuclease-3